jgi:hypothetical protein
MGEVVNLRQARKRAERRERDAKAEANRASYGRSRGEKRAARIEAERVDAVLDGHRLDPGPGGRG